MVAAETGEAQIVLHHNDNQNHTISIKIPSLATGYLRNGNNNKMTFSTNRRSSTSASQLTNVTQRRSVAMATGHARTAVTKVGVTTRSHNSNLRLRQRGISSHFIHRHAQQQSAQYSGHPPQYAGRSRRRHSSQTSTRTFRSFNHSRLANRYKICLITVTIRTPIQDTLAASTIRLKLCSVTVSSVPEALKIGRKFDLRLTS